MNKTIIGLCLLLLAGCTGKKEAGKENRYEQTFSISTSEMIQTLSSDEFEGRKPGTPGMKNSVYITEIDNNVDEIPTEYKLMQNYPNPFNPTTVIGYQLPIAGHVSLIVYDILGRQISKLVDEYKQPGNYKIAFNGQQTTNNRQLTSGIYFARLNVQPVNGSNQFDSVIKMLLVK